VLDGPFRGSEAVARGLLTKNHLRGRRYTRLFPDIYIPARTEPLDLVERSRAAYLLVEGHGVLGGFSAAALLGADCSRGHAAAEVIVERDVRRHPGLLVRRGRVTGPDLWGAQYCRVTSPLRTAWDLARRLDLVEAVVAVDALARVEVPKVPAFAPADLLQRRVDEPGARGCRSLDRVVALAIRARSRRWRHAFDCCSCWPGCRRQRSSTSCATRSGA
jgi:hypothetical protein